MVYLKKTVRGALPSSYRKPSESRYYSNNPKSHLTYLLLRICLGPLASGTGSPRRSTLYIQYRTAQRQGKTRQDKTRQERRSPSTNIRRPRKTWSRVKTLGVISKTRSSLERERERERPTHIKHQGQDQDSIQTHRLFWPRPPLSSREAALYSAIFRLQCVWPLWKRRIITQDLIKPFLRFSYYPAIPKNSSTARPVPTVPYVRTGPAYLTRTE
jgi:hypothetical protein